MMPERLLTLQEACRRLGIHPNTLRRWDKQGKIRVVRTVGGRRRIPESELERLMGFVKPDVSRKAVIYAGVSQSRKVVWKGRGKVCWTTPNQGDTRLLQFWKM
jgi:putative resolvase